VVTLLLPVFGCFYGIWLISRVFGIVEHWDSAGSASILPWFDFSTVHISIHRVGYFHYDWSRRLLALHPWPLTATPVHVTVVAIVAAAAAGLGLAVWWPARWLLPGRGRSTDTRLLTFVHGRRQARFVLLGGHPCALTGLVCIPLSGVIVGLAFDMVQETLRFRYAYEWIWLRTHGDPSFPPTLGTLGTPDALLVLGGVLAFIPAWVLLPIHLRLRRSRFIAKRFCRRCGYPRPAGAVCPECGTVPDLARQT
jgi:hypothetical protein